MDNSFIIRKAKESNPDYYLRLLNKIEEMQEVSSRAYVALEIATHADAVRDIAVLQETLLNHFKFNYCDYSLISDSTRIFDILKFIAENLLSESANMLLAWDSEKDSFRISILDEKNICISSTVSSNVLISMAVAVAHYRDG